MKSFQFRGFFLTPSIVTLLQHHIYFESYFLPILLDLSLCFSYAYVSTSFFSILYHLSQCILIFFVVSLFVFSNFIFFNFIYFILDRGKGGREGEKHQHVVASRVPLTGDLAHNPGMCPDWELNWRPFGSQANTQSTESHQPRLIVCILYQTVC